MEIGIAGFIHESNTFSVQPTTLEDFQVYEGQALIDYYAPTFHEIAGYIAGADEFDFTTYPMLAAGATPAGPLTRDTYETLIKRLLKQIEDAPQIDGLLLALHGAMVAEDFPQADGETVRRVRQLVGPDFPIVVTHDYHGNVPEQLVKDANALIIYKTCPHIDQRERGIEAAELLARTIRGEVKPVGAIAKPEVVFNIVYHNTELPPMKPIMEAAIALESQPGILSCSVAAGYQYADVPDMGPCVVVVADGDEALAQREADRLGQMMWDAREQLHPNVPDAREAVKRAIAATQGPVGTVGPIGLFELGDNVGGGSAADSTAILQELIRQKADGWVVVIYDPESVKQCYSAGIGASVTLEVGGKIDDDHGPTLTVSGRVRTFHDGKYMETERRHGGRRHYDQGLTAVLEVGRTHPEKGGLIVLNSIRDYPMSIHQITCAGIVPSQQKILVAKGAVAPRAAYEPVCTEIIEVDTPGATSISRAPEEFHLARKTFYEWR